MRKCKRRSRHDDDVCFQSQSRDARAVRSLRAGGPVAMNGLPAWTAAPPHTPPPAAPALSHHFRAALFLLSGVGVLACFNLICVVREVRRLYDTTVKQRAEQEVVDNTAVEEPPPPPPELLCA